MQPLVSVIVPCFNAQLWIAQCVDSVLRQSYPKVELIVVDDGSSDDSGRLLSAYGNKLKLISQTQLGACRARNAGLAEAQGDFVQFLDADDYLLPNAIEAHVRNLTGTGSATCMSFGWWRHEFVPARTLGDVRKDLPRDDLLTALLTNWWIAACAVVWRKTDVQRIGGWDETFPTAQDTELMFRAAAMGCTFSVVDQVVGIYRQHPPGEKSVSQLAGRARQMVRALTKLRDILEAQGRLPDYSRALASAARTTAKGLLQKDFPTYSLANELADGLCVSAPPDGSLVYRMLWRLIGMRRTERIADLKRRWTMPG